jgi:asparaginyl-tRNA synthetase
MAGRSILQTVFHRMIYVCISLNFFFTFVSLFCSPVFVTDYPKDIKSFYMKQNADGKTVCLLFSYSAVQIDFVDVCLMVVQVAATDLLLPGMGELIGGSAREDDHDKLKRRMIETNMDLEPYQWYLDLRKYAAS